MMIPRYPVSKRKRFGRSKIALLFITNVYLIVIRESIVRFPINFSRSSHLNAVRDSA